MDYIKHAVTAICHKIIGHLKNDKGVHAETAIAVSAGLAAISILKKHMDPFILNDQPLDEEGLKTAIEQESKQTIQHLLEVAQKLGWQVNSIHNNLAIPKHNQPDKDVLKFVDELQAFCWLEFEKRQINKNQYTFILTMATIELIKLTKNVLPPKIGLSIALHYFIQIVRSKVNIVH